MRGKVKSTRKLKQKAERQKKTMMSYGIPEPEAQGYSREVGEYYSRVNSAGARKKTAKRTAKKADKKGE